MKILYRSVYHPAYLLVLALIVMLIWLSIVLLNDFFHAMQMGEKVHWGATLFAPCILLAYSVYTISLYYSIMCRIIITNNVLIVGRNQFSLEIIQEVYHKRQQYKFLFAFQKQQSIAVKISEWRRSFDLEKPLLEWKENKANTNNVVSS
ncbi:MAG: hypothetical protein J0L80_13765 [Chitinophagales bacterium]|nr:hypothetical protein [Chitinophagales bacterium]